MQLEEPAIRHCVRDDQEQDVDLPVAELQREPAFHRLGIAKARLTLASRSPPTQNEQRVPSPAVSWNGQWHLRSPECLPRKPPAKSFEDSQLAGVARGIAIRERPTTTCRPTAAAARGTPDRLSG